MKKIIVALFILVTGITAKAQKTTPANYTYIAQRYEWIAGVFQALGLPAGGNAAFTTGQVPRAGALYYDSTGGDAGLKVWTGLAWAAVDAGISQSTLDDTAAAIRGDFPVSSLFGTTDNAAIASRSFNLGTNTFTLSGDNASGYYFLSTATAGDRGLNYTQNRTNIFGNEADGSTTNAKLTTTTNNAGTNAGQIDLLTSNTDGYSNQITSTVTNVTGVMQLSSTNPTQGHRINLYGNKIDVFATTGNMNLNLITLPNKSSLLSTDSLLLNDDTGKTWKISKDDLGLSSGSITANLIVVSAGTGQDTWYKADTSLYMKRIINSRTLTDSSIKITANISTTASSSTPTPDADISDQFNVTALAANATFGAPTGTPSDGQALIIRIKDNGTARTLAFNAIYRASTDLAFPTTTVISKTMYLQFIYNAADSKWDFTGKTDGF